MSIFYPENAPEAVEWVQQTLESGQPLVPAGLMNRLNSWPKAIDGSVKIISSQKLNNMISVEPENLLAVAEAGMTPAQVRQALKPAGIYWPVSGLDGRSLGGIMAEGALGLETMAKGQMTDWILGATFINPLGKEVSSGGRTLKNVSGYDLTRFQWRSWGTLGFSTRFILKCLPVPEASKVVELELSDAGKAVELSEKLILQRISPQCIRLSLKNRQWKALIWLAGFAEMVEAKVKKIKDLAPEAKSLVHDEALDFWNEYLASWPVEGGGQSHYRGARRAVLELPPLLAEGRLNEAVSEADLDVGGGQARFKWNSAQPEDFQWPASLRKVAPSGEGEVYGRLKKGLDPGNLFFPESLRP